MSKHTHSRIWSDIQHLSTAELEDLYGIQIEEDGSVWDTLEHKGFETLSEWAAYTESLEDDDSSEYGSMKKSYYYDDD